MKMPQRPPLTEEMLEKTDLSETDLKSHFEAAVKYNSGYLHWDDALADFLGHVERKRKEHIDLSIQCPAAPFCR